MWDCPTCGCLAVAASLLFCPMCGKERDMPKATVSSGASNGWADAEAAAEAPAEVPADEVVPEVPEPVQAVSEPAKPEPVKPEPRAEVKDEPKGM